jgi:hypothetical protein
MKKIDAFPEVPEWNCENFEITGDKMDARDPSGKTMLTEEIELSPSPVHQRADWEPSFP